MALSKTKKFQQEISSKNTSVIKKIGLIGPWGCGNLGDAAIQKAMIQNVRQYYPDAQIYGFSINPQDTEDRHGIPSFPMCKWYGLPSFARIGATSNLLISKLLIPIRILAKLFLEPIILAKYLIIVPDFDALIVSGGGQLDDVFNGAWGQPYSLLLWGLLSRLHKIKFLIVSVGAGPINKPLSKFFFKKALSLANYRSYRDKNSKQYIERVINFPITKDPIYPDIAHSLELNTYQAYANPRKENRTVVGIAPIPHKYARTPPGLPGDNTPTYKKYHQKLVSFVSWLLENNYMILFFTGENDADRPIIEDVKNSLDKNGVVYSPDRVIDRYTRTVNELMLQIAETDLVVASRFHGVLLSQLLNKPTLALSFHDKVDSLMANTNQLEYCLPIDNIDVDTLINRFQALEANQTTIKSQLEKRTQRYKAALAKQYEYLLGSL